MSETNKAPAAKPAAETEQPLYYWGTGRRKRAVARVRLKPGSGQLVINKKRTIEDYFVRDQDKLILLAPLRVTGTKTKFDVFVNVKGGGSTGQAGAVCMGIARALVKADAANAVPLRAAGFLTRDAREVERKKPGQAGARRSFQFSKR